jgi:prephenate dehydrogenase
MNIAIVGLGLIGGSIGLALKSASGQIKIVGIPRREETIQDAVGRKAIDWGTTDLLKGVKDADIVFLCTPINLIVPKIKEMIPALKKGVIVTDVGSSKEEIVSQAEKLMPEGTFFVGGHPMAGKEEVKLEAAESDLLKDRIYILTETSKTDKNAVEKLEEVVKLMGSKVIKMDAKLHDLVVAGISHMPLAVAAALVNTIANSDKGKEAMKTCAASGFQDTTRIASGDPGLGTDMFVTNKKSVLKQISQFKKSLSKMEKLIKKGDPVKIEAELKRSKAFRDSIYG